jgi:hypothetical protein
MPETTERFNIVLSNYPEEVQTSNAQSKKYIKKGKKLNLVQQKCLERNLFEWKERGTGTAKGLYLYDLLKGEFIVAKKAGTPKIKKINGQLFWQSGPGTEWDRQAIKDYLRTWFVPAITRSALPEKIFAPKDHFIHFEYIFYYPFDLTRMTQYQDYINHAYVRSKTFEDILVEMEIIKDDNPTFVRGGYARYVCIPVTENRRLEIKIHFCKNDQRVS